MCVGEEEEIRAGKFKLRRIMRRTIENARPVQTVAITPIAIFIYMYLLLLPLPFPLPYVSICRIAGSHIFFVAGQRRQAKDISAHSSTATEPIHIILTVVPVVSVRDLCQCVRHIIQHIDYIKPIRNVRSKRNSTQYQQFWVSKKPMRSTVVYRQNT